MPAPPVYTSLVRAASFSLTLQTKVDPVMVAMFARLRLRL